MVTGEIWYALEVAQLLKYLNSGEEGLSAEEAARRLDEYGPNELRGEAGSNPLKLLLGQFRNFLIILLLIAVLVSFLIGEALDAGVILAIVIASVALGFIQEYRAERAIEALKQMTAPAARVVRDGVELEIPAAQVVPGDLLVVETGDRVVADARLIEAFNLEIDEAPLTGESTPVSKHPDVLPTSVPLAERENMVFAGTIVTYGRGRAMVVETGMETEFGKIAGMLQTIEEPKTPLERRMGELGRWLGIAALIVVAAVSALGILRGQGLFDMFIWGVSLAVAAVPEALPAVVTGSLAIGVQRMARRNAIVRRLSAVETLGSTTVICSDKTGTLTRGEMTVRRIYVGSRNIEVTGTGYDPDGEIAAEDVSERELAPLLHVALLCNDAQLRQEEGRWESIGDPTEGALVVVAMKGGLVPEEIRSEYLRVGEIPFDSQRKRMSTVHVAPDGRKLAYMKGALEMVLERCSRFRAADGETIELRKSKREAILEANERMTGEALRVLGLAYRELSPSLGVFTEETVEQDLVFLGLMGMIDPPRQEAKRSVALCRRAGIKTVMITGDHRLTAMAVARELDILNHGRVLSGEELERISDEAFQRVVEEISVYTRVSPEHKMKIVNALQANDHVVAMTGDGVNDAPALKSSDIGVAMGITGTAVSQEAADMVLSDDNYATLVEAAREGRGIYDNIKKYLAYLLSSNVGEILVMLFAGLLGFPLPLAAIQILWVNLVTDGLPALALGIDPPDPDIMQRAPRSSHASIFTPGVKAIIITMAILMTISTLPIFYWYNPTLGTGDAYTKAQTMVFTLLVMFEMFNAFNCRSDRHSILEIGPFKNRYLILAVLSSILLQLLVIYTPSLQSAFRTVPLNLHDWLIVLAVSSTGLLGVEVVKRTILARGG
ncbi:MAG: calcium-transporting P-type ATPase, PMR1-type [Candidatus Bipolaricaulia bacterium]